MKKLFQWVILLALLMIPALSCYGAGIDIKVFYNGNTYIPSQTVLPYDNDYFFAASEISDFLGINFTEDSSRHSISFEYNGSQCLFPIKSSIYPKVKASPGTHDFPEMINGRLYFPLGFIKKACRFTIKINEDSGSIYLLPGERVSDTSFRIFNNLTYDYSIVLPRDVFLEFWRYDGSFNDNSIRLRDRGNLFAASITCDMLDEKTMKAMREYLADYKSSDKEIFSRFAEYKNSYFRAVQEGYKKDFLYGNTYTVSGESNMKIFGKYHDKVYGNDSDTYLYNTITSKKSDTFEDTHISISLPVPAKKAIYTINFTIAKGCLNQAIIDRLSGIVNSIQVSGLEPQQNTLKVFTDKKSLRLANSGIYPPLIKIPASYSELKNEELGYSIKYPSSFIPYLQNNLVSSFDYKSFKIDSTRYFSISVEPAPANEEVAESKIRQLRELYGQKLEITQNAVIKLGKNDFRYIKYILRDDESTVYVQNYLTINNSRLYEIQLNSRYSDASAMLQNEFTKIVKSLEIFPQPAIEASKELPYVRFTSKDKSCTFLYPYGWKVIQEASSGQNYSIFRIKSPDYSGPIEMSTFEGSLDSELTYPDIIQFSGMKDADYVKSLPKGYSPPFQGNNFKLLKSSHYSRNGVDYIYRLINYLDESDRSKLCYSIDIIKGKKIYSLFISASDYSTKDGRLSNKDLSSVVNVISNSFSPIDAKQYKEELARDKKLAFIEQFFKKKFGTSTTVSSAISLNSSNDMLITLNGTESSGVYKIKADLSNNDVDIVGSVFTKNLSYPDAKQLESQYHIYFSSQDELLKIYNSLKNGEKCFTDVYVDLEGSPGYLRLEIDPSNNISVLSYRSLEDIYNSIITMYSAPNSGYTPINYSISTTDRFTVKVFLASKSDNTFKAGQVSVKFNKQTNNFDVETKK